MAYDPSSVCRAAGLAGAAARWKKPEAIARKRELAEAQISDYIMRVVAKAPPLAPAQRDRIAALIKAGK
ncbi:hypothetical protein BTZ20_2216 [Rhodococcus sp. MTM3W5.2]|uniref:hypothetical protein n=1 Tax=Rhodococcus sp. MTM3W5.2 TaxID=1805827 RepID=UPI0009797C40|nr:hypothetical protein [Rhodococcus sp. MTM3W5.2]AQA21709.1 hypothetical protein BTZ20_2216 [Rhodococcus sp. MTM3W5.2]